MDNDRTSKEKIQQSNDYDTIHNWLTFFQSRRYRRYLATKLPEKHSLALLDVATGTGELITALFEENPNIDVIYGIDKVAEVLAVAHKKFESKPFSNRVHLQNGDAKKMPFFHDEQFDVVTIAFGTSGIEDIEAVLKELYRVLKKDGMLLVLDCICPQNRLVKKVYSFYVRQLCRFLGGNALNGYIERVATENCAYFRSSLKNSLFREIKDYSLCLGSVVLYEGLK